MHNPPPEADDFPEHNDVFIYWGRNCFGHSLSLLTVQMTRKKAYWLTGILLLVTVLAANLTPLNWLFMISVDADRYCYANLSGTVTVMENRFKNRAISDFSQFSHVKPECRVPGFEGDTLMYRLFSKQPLAFWRWKEYLTDERYNLPYITWETIKERRMPYIDTLSNTPCRDF